MKKLLIIILLTVLNADVSMIINTLKKMEAYKPHFKPLIKYNIFAKDEKKDIKSVLKTAKKSINKQLVIRALFMDKANINGKWVKAGDIIDGYEVVKVKKNGVYVKQNNIITFIGIKTSVLKVGK